MSLNSEDMDKFEINKNDGGDIQPVINQDTTHNVEDNIKPEIEKKQRRPSNTSRSQIVMGSGVRRKSNTGRMLDVFDLESIDSSIDNDGASLPELSGLKPQKVGTNSTVLSKKLTHSNTLVSKLVSIKYEDSQLVPVSRRRGLFAKWTVIPEYKDARELPDKLRDFIVFIVAFCAMLGPMGTSILLPAEDNAVADLNTTVTIFNVAIGIYLVTLGVVPLWWSNFSERHGRRSIYIISFAMYLCFTIGCALSTSINMLIGFRVLSGGCAASVQSVGAGTIGDLYPMTKRGSAMGIFYLGPLCGPLLSPIIGGAITSNKSLGWRATQWFLVILSGVCLIMIIFLLPETLRLQENKEAIRQILRDRRRQHIVKDNEKADLEKQNEVNKSLKNDNSYDLSVNPNEGLSSYDSVKESLGSNISSNISNENTDFAELHVSKAFERDEDVIIDDEEEDEELDNMTMMLTRLSTNHSIIDEDDEPPVVGDMVQISKVPTKTNERILKRRITNANDPEFRKKKIEKNLLTLESLKKEGIWAQFKYICKIYGYGPLKAFVFLRYPPVFLSIAYAGPCFAALYVCNMTLTFAYSRPPYNFGPLLVGLVYIPNSITYFIASIWGGKFNDYLLKKKIAKYGVIAPEARFGINVYVAAAFIPCSLLIIGWCLNFHKHWVTPLIGTSLFGFAQMIVIGVTMTYLADCLPGKGATGIALNNFIRQIMAAAVSFVTEPLIKAIGIGVLFSICAGICAVLSILIYLIVRNGDRWREEYDLENLYDIFES